MIADFGLAEGAKVHPPLLTGTANRECYNFHLLVNGESPLRNVSQFVAKWRKVELTERSASQQHFLDLCNVFDHPTPAEADPTGESFTFEKGAAKHGGGQGWADVWKRNFFGWEYKGKHKDLVAVYDQLLKYHEALENPPLLVVCDMDRFEIHTNFTATVSKTHLISLDDLDTPRNIEIMRNVFFDPPKLRPDATSEAITQEVAQRVAQIWQTEFIGHIRLRTS